MKTSCLIASLAAAVSALDVRLWVSSTACQDSGAAAVCTNWNPNTCCGVPSGSFPSVGFYAVPRQWFLEYRGHEGGDCRNTKTIEANLGIEFKCLRNGPYTGAGYGFRSRKRDTGEDMVCAGEGVEKECKGYQRPDVLETADGKKFSLTDLSDDQMLEMFEQEANGTMGYAYQRLEIAE